MCKESHRGSGKEDFPDEDVLDVELGTWKMYFDGAVNWIGVVLITFEGSHMPLAIKLNFEATLNMKHASLEWKPFKIWG